MLLFSAVTCGQIFIWSGKIPISQELVTLLHICRVLPTPQSVEMPQRSPTLLHRPLISCIEHRDCGCHWGLSVSWCFTCVLWVFTMFYECFTMFYECFTSFMSVLLCFLVVSLCMGVSQCFKSVSECFTGVSRCFNCVVMF